jgi:hypothetical protein
VADEEPKDYEAVLRERLSEVTDEIEPDEAQALALIERRTGAASRRNGGKRDKS